MTTKPRWLRGLVGGKHLRFNGDGPLSIDARVAPSASLISILFKRVALEVLNGL